MRFLQRSQIRTGPFVNGPSVDCSPNMWIIDVDNASRDRRKQILNQLPTMVLRNASDYYLLEVSHDVLGLSGGKHLKVLCVLESDLTERRSHAPICDETVGALVCVSGSVFIPLVVVLKASAPVQLIVKEQSVQGAPANQHGDSKPFAALDASQQPCDFFVRCLQAYESRANLLYNELLISNHLAIPQLVQITSHQSEPT